MSNEVDTLTELIQLDDSQAITALGSFVTSLSTAQDKVTGLQSLVDSLATAMGGDFDAAKQKVSDLNEVLNTVSKSSEWSSGKGFDAAIFNQVTQAVQTLSPAVNTLSTNWSDYIDTVATVEKMTEGWVAPAEEGITVADALGVSVQQLNDAFEKDGGILQAVDDLMQNGLIQSSEDASTSLQRLQGMFQGVIPPTEQVAQAFDKDAAAIENISANAQELSSFFANIDDIEQKLANPTPMEAQQAAVQAWLNSLDAVDNKVNETTDAVQKEGEAGQEAGEKLVQSDEEAVSASGDLEKAISKVGTAIQFALGLGIFQIVSAVVNQFKEAVTYGIQFSQAMYELNTGVNLMRQSGIDVTLKSMSDSIAQLAKEFPNIAIPDFTKLVAQITFITAGLGATPNEIMAIAQAAAIANQNTGNDIQTITTALIGASEDQTGAWQRKLATLTGVSISTQEVYNEAVLEGVAGNAKSYTQLDQNARLLATSALLVDDYNKKVAAGADYGKTQAGEIADLSASWKNVQTAVGQLVDPWLGKLADLIKEITPLVQNLVQDFIVGFQLMLLPITTVVGSLVVLYKTIQNGDWKDFVSNVAEVHRQILDTLNASAAPISSTAGLPDQGVPIGAKPVPDSGGLDAQTQAKIEADAEKQIIDLHDSEAAALENIQVDLGNKLIDLKTKNVRDLAAIDVDAQNKAISIAQDTAETLLVDAEKKRLDDIEAQQKYYEELENLRNTFELNLEDALRSRDAKTIIHLIEQYDLSKQQKAQQYADETVIRNENYQQEIDLANQQEQYKLEQLKQEVAQRKAALAIQYQQEIADAKTNADRQTTAEQVDISNRIKAWEDGLMLQYTITDTQMKSIYDNINAYLGKNGYVDSVYTYIIARMMQVYAAMSSLGGATTTPADTPLGYGHGNGMAKGGSLFANTPTSVTFGEAGPELAMFMPLGSGFAGSPSASFAGGSGGAIQLQVTLDDNLQAQIVNTTLNNVALSIDRMQRS